MGSSDTPLISCMMPTYGRPAYVNESVAMFLAQDYPAKELIVLNDCPGQNYRCDLPGVRVINVARRYRTLGEKRNAAIELAAGEIITVWDDDDVHLPWRLSISLREMRRWTTRFYRPANFWAYWGEPKLHNNQSVPGWVSHGTATFTKELWRSVGGYPARGVGEDAEFFQRIHEELNQAFIKHPIAPEERFFILRGKSRYKHMSIGGGEQPSETTSGDYTIKPSPIRDPVLRQACERLTEVFAMSYEMRSGPSGTGEATRPQLSVCVSLKNRSCVNHKGRRLRLFPRCVESLAQAAAALSDDEPVELVVADFRSDDWPLEKWIDDAAGVLQLQVLQMEGDFSKGRGLNVAAEHARSERLFLCDADMLLTPHVLRQGLQALSRGAAMFPIFLCLTAEGVASHRATLSYGNAFVNRSVFRAAGGVPEFQSWGGEDDLFRDRVARLVPIERESPDGFEHQWHPERCRHEHYLRPRRSDYDAFRAGTQSSTDPKPWKVFFGEHPHWLGEVDLFLDGRMSRPGFAGGAYELIERQRVTLKWNDWAAETLVWDETDGLFRDPSKPFTLREIHSAGTDGDSPVRPAVDRPVIRIGFHGFWGGFDVRGFSRMFGVVIPGYDFQVSDRPDIVFTSVFTNDRDAGRRRWPRAVHVFFTGENRRPPLEEFDYCLSFYRDVKDPRHLRLPLFVTDLNAEGYRMRDLIKKGPVGDPPHRREKFCAFLQRNCGVRLRNQFVKRLSEYKRVDCAGGCLKNVSVQLPGFQSKLDFLRKYKFTVRFENTTTRADEGYVTEKLPHAMLAGCVPLYAGDRRVNEDFHASGFIRLDDFDGDLDAMVRRVIEIDQDDGQCQAMAEAPWFHDNRVPAHLDETRLRAFFERVMERALANSGRR